MPSSEEVHGFTNLVENLSIVIIRCDLAITIYDKK